MWHFRKDKKIITFFILFFFLLLLVFDGRWGKLLFFCYIAIYRWIWIRALVENRYKYTKIQDSRFDVNITLYKQILVLAVCSAAASAGIPRMPITSTSTLSRPDLAFGTLMNQNKHDNIIQHKNNLPAKKLTKPDIDTLHREVCVLAASETRGQ